MTQDHREALHTLDHAENDFERFLAALWLFLSLPLSDYPDLTGAQIDSIAAAGKKRDKVNAATQSSQF